MGWRAGRVVLKFWGSMAVEGQRRRWKILLPNAGAPLLQGGGRGFFGMDSMARFFLIPTMEEEARWWWGWD